MTLLQISAAFPFFRHIIQLYPKILFAQDSQSDRVQLPAFDDGVNSVFQFGFSHMAAHVAVGEGFRRMGRRFGTNFVSISTRTLETGCGTGDKNPKSYRSQNTGFAVRPRPSNSCEGTLEFN